MPNLDQQIAAVHRAWKDAKNKAAAANRRDKPRLERDVEALGDAARTLIACQEMMNKARTEAAYEQQDTQP